MPASIQKSLIQWLLEPCARLTDKIPEVFWDVMFSISVLGIAIMMFVSEAGLYTGRYLYLYLLEYFFIAIMILAGLKPNLTPVRFSLPLSICWFGITLFMLLTGVFVRDIDALLTGLPWLIVFPVFYLVWGNQKFDRLAQLFLRGALLSFAVCAAVSVFFYPINTIAYQSFFHNRNSTSLFCVFAFVCIWSYILAAKRFSLRVLGLDLALGFSAAFIYYTNSRTGQITAGLCFVTSSLLLLFIRRKDWKRALLCQLLPALAAIVLLLPNAIYVFHDGYELKTTIQAQLSLSDDTPSKPSPALIPEDPSSIREKISDYNKQRFDTGEKDLDGYTAGRVELWHIHLREVGLLGNRTDKVLYNAQGEVENRNSHFTVLEFAYCFGAPAGILFLIFNILSGLGAIYYAVKYPNNKYHLFPFIAVITYDANSTMEVLLSSTPSNLFLLYLVVQTPILMLHSSLSKNTPNQGKTEELFHE